MAPAQSSSPHLTVDKGIQGHVPGLPQPECGRNTQERNALATPRLPWSLVTEGNYPLVHTGQWAQDRLPNLLPPKLIPLFNQVKHLQ